MLFVMLDLSNAFETIDHEQLQTLLHDEYSVLEKVLSGFRTYLEFCAQRVQIDYNIPDYSRYKVVCHITRSLCQLCPYYIPFQCSGYLKDMD